MKKLVLLAVLLQLTLSGQIVFDQKYSVSSYGQYGLSYTRFSSAGFKYTLYDQPLRKLDFYNVNHSLYLSVTIPVPTTSVIYEIHGISDQLFNKDTLIEYAVTTDGSNGRLKVVIFNQAGVQIFSKDSAMFYSQGYEDLLNYSGIFYDGIRYKMKLGHLSQSNNPSAFLVYDLPGSLPCTSCATFTTPSTTTGVQGAIKQVGNEATFYPNPAHEELKLRYELPADFKNAEIRIFDLQGKHIQDYKVTSAFDFLYLPIEFNNGMYLYSLIVDGKVIKNEKILLVK